MADEGAGVFDFSGSRGFGARTRGDSSSSECGDSGRAIPSANTNLCGCGAELEE